MSGMVKIETEAYEPGCCVEAESPSYPWGSRLTFRDQMLESLDIADLPVGAEVMVQAYAVVSSKSQSEEGGKVETSLELQLTEVSATPHQTSSLMDRFYGE